MKEILSKSKRQALVAVLAFVLVFSMIVVFTLAAYNQIANARGSFLNNKPLPSSECMVCPYDGNQGRIVRLYFDPQEQQWIWTISCYKNHVWECYANPAR